MRNHKTNWPYINLCAVQPFSNLNSKNLEKIELSFDITEVNFIPNFNTIFKKLDTFLKNCKDQNFKFILCQSNIENIADDLEIFSKKYNIKFLAEYSENIMYKKQLQNINFNQMLKEAVNELF